MGQKILELKQWLKDTTINIREARSTFKDSQRNSPFKTMEDWTIHYNKESRLYSLRHLYRHRHIAYSELRGTPREKIENPREDNLPDEDIIGAIKEDYQDETVCVSA